MSTDFETRARAAAAALHEELADVDPPVLPTVHPARRRLPLVLAAAAVTLVALAVVGLLLQDGGDDGETVVAGPNADVPRLVPDHVPAGHVLIGAQDLPVEGGEPTAARLRLYGAGVGDDPFGGGDLGVMTLGPPSAEATLPDGTEITVRGQEARVIEPEPGAPFPTVTWFEPGVGLAQVLSKSLPREELLRLVEALVVEDGALALPDGSRPDGFELLLDDPRQIGLGLTSGLLAGTEGHLLAYQGEDQSPRYVTVLTAAGDADALLSLRWFADDEQAVDVRGHPGVLVSLSTGEGAVTYVLAWPEADGVVASVTVLDVSEEELFAIADSLREVDEAEWQLLVDGIDPFAGDTGTGHVIAQGELESVDWRLSMQNSDLCFDYRTASGDGFGSCVGTAGPEGEPLEPETIGRPDVASGQQAGPVFVYGQVSNDVPLVEVELADGTVVAAEVVDPGLDTQFYVAGLPTGSAPPVEVRALDGERAVIAARAVDGAVSLEAPGTAPTTIAATVDEGGTG